jgi:hypothetical protein
MNTPNLPSLLSAITVAKLKVYLAKEGWNARISDGRVYFEKETEPGETQTIFVPEDRTHPRFRSLLQNLMFSLSVSEIREPFEIASDIAACHIPIEPNPAELAPQMHEIATIIRGLAHECVESEQARGKILELARFLLSFKSRTLGLTPAIADELWEIARADNSYLPATTVEWLEANARMIPPR